MSTTRRSRVVVLLALASIVTVAAMLRLAGNDAGLRHRPPADERDFVENVGRMLVAGDLDHRHYLYPGLVFYVLYPVLAVHQPVPFGADAYLAVRRLAAGFGVLSVLLTFFLARRLGGPVAGLGAAALVAVSPVEVMSAYPFKPDVVLETFCLVALLTFDRLDERRWTHLRAGVATGLALAIKFTGVLLLPVYAVRVLAAVGPRRARALGFAAALATLVTFALASPYTFLHWHRAFAGALAQAGHHYPDSTLAGGLGRTLAGYGERWWLYATILGTRGIGLAGTGLVLAAVWFDRREWRRWIHLLAFPLVLISVFASSPLKHDRFLLASLSSAATLAGMGLASLAARSAPLAALIGAAALVLQVPVSVHYVGVRMAPSTRDTTVDFLSAHAKTGDRILNAVQDLGLDRERFEVIRPTGDPERDRLLARHSNWLILRDEDLWLATRRRWPIAWVSTPVGRWSGHTITVVRMPPAERVHYAPVSLKDARFTSSFARADLAPAHDGSRHTYWKTPRPQEPGDWIQVTFAGPTPLARAELDLGARFKRYARGLRLLVSEDGAHFAEAACVDERPPMREQLRAPRWPSQVLVLLKPRRVRALRLVQTGHAAKPWGLAELRLYAATPGPWATGAGSLSP